MSNLEDPALGPTIELDYIGILDLETEPDEVYTGKPNAQHVSRVRAREYLASDYFSIRMMRNYSLEASLVLILFACYGFVVDSMIDFLAPLYAIVFMCSIIASSHILGHAGPRQARPIQATSWPLQLRDGLYSLRKSGSHLGIGYVERGTLYSRYHVTSGLSLDVGGHIVTPCYTNLETDNVAYGKPPSWAPLADGDIVTVALASFPQVPIKTCRSIVSETSGSFVFLANSAGHAGSPVFKRVESRIGGRPSLGQQLVGSLGHAGISKSKFGTRVSIEDKQITESLEPDCDARVAFDVTFNKGRVTQFFAHPGFGKTSQVLPDLVARGLADFERIYVSARSVQNCARIQKILMQKHGAQVAFFTSSREEPLQGFEGGPIRVIQHADLLCMLVSQSPVVRARGLWILDGCDFMSSRSLMLRDYIRNRCQADGQDALVELAAGGFEMDEQRFVFRDQSNYPIESVELRPHQMMDKIEDEARSRRVLVFATSTRDGDETSVRNLSSRLKKQGINCLEYRGKSLDACELANWNQGVLLTRDTFEIEPELAFDAVFDFQKSVRPVRSGNWTICLRLGNTDMCEHIKRRGSVGRFKPGTYYSPGFNSPAYDITRADYFDRGVFASALGIRLIDYPVRDSSSLKLTGPQVCSWLASPIRGPYLAKLVFAADGRERNREDYELQRNHWLSSDNVPAKTDGSPLRVGFWDERDESTLIKLAKGLNWAEVKSQNSSWLTCITRWASSFSFSLSANYLR